jgi:hypothetical protein
MPSRFAVIPRRGGTEDIRWFEADPTFVLHFTNAYEDGDEIVLDGFFEGEPNPVDSLTGDKWEKAFRFLALDRLQTRLHRWRFNLATGEAREEQLSDSITEFGMINAGYAGGKYRYAYAATGKPSWFLFDGLVKHDLHTGSEQRFSFEDGVYGSETAMAPRIGSTAEDDGYLVTLTTDMNDDASTPPGWPKGRCANWLCRNGSRVELTRRGRRDQTCGAGAKPTPRQQQSDSRWSSPSPTPSPECWGCSATSGRYWSCNRRCSAQRGSPNSRRACRYRIRYSPADCNR